jgi:hypothetical protein
MPTSFVHSFIFPHLVKGLGPTGSPLPPMGFSCNFPQTLYLTKVLSVEETLIYFSSTYAPNLIHQGASLISEISSTNGYRNPTSPKHLLVHPWPKKCISKGHKTIQLAIKSACAQNTKEARALVENTEKANMRLMRDCGRKNPCIP